MDAAMTTSVNAVGAGVRRRPARSAPAPVGVMRRHALLVWQLSAQDLRWRRRRFVIGLVATGLVFGLSLLLAGITAGFGMEAARTVAQFQASSWLVKAGGLGPFTGPQPFPAAEARSALRLAGVTSATAVFVGRANTPAQPGQPAQQVNVIGIGGRLPGPRAAIANDNLGVAAGGPLVLNGVRFRVASLLHGVTMLGGQPFIMISLSDAQRMFAGGAPLATSIVLHGATATARARALPGFTRWSNEAVRADIVRPLEPAKQTIQFVSWLLWLTAGGIIGALVYLSALERNRDFAVLKAIGVPDVTLLLGLVFQSVTLALFAVGLGCGLELLLAPMSQIPVAVPTAAYPGLAVVGVAVGVAASAASVRKAHRVDPALAFGGA